MPQTSHAGIPALVVARSYTALGMLRCLARAGIPAYLACPPDDLAALSRWFRPTPGAVPWHGTIDDQAGARLAAMPLDEAVLITGADNAALWAADVAAGPLAQRFHTSSSSRRTLEILQDKARFGRFLRDAGLPHPRTFPLDRFADIAQVPFGELDRVFVKPKDSQRFNKALDKKGIWADSRVELERVWTGIHALGFGVIAQEYVPGTAADHYFIDGFRDRHGVIKGVLARRRWRIFPPDFGNSSYCESVALRQVSGAFETLSELLERLHYRGIFSAEFKRDARDGSFRILEVNTRAWWYVEFAARCGVNVCAMAYDDALERAAAPTPSRYRVGVGCVNWINDVKSVCSPGGRQGASWLRIIWQWLWARYHVLCLDDPRPGLKVIREALISVHRRAHCVASRAR
ncbi:MAG: hypothetical protein KGJ55_08265 [Gammaproteobacteria bacterium]|nr:hypothetical protein [Gammaproteobacteria bacterium]